MRGIKLIKITQYLLPILTLYFLVFTIFQFGLGMDMDDKTNCPLILGHSAVICQMNPLEHIQEWQSMFTTLPARDVFLFISIFFILLALRILLPWHKLRINILSQSFLRFRFRVFNTFQVISPLQEALSRGILNPKLF